MESFSSFTSRLSARYPPTTGSTKIPMQMHGVETLVYEPRYRFHVALVLLFSICSIIAGGFALFKPACDSIVSTCVKVITITYAIEVLLCSIRFPIAHLAKKSRGNWKTKWIKAYNIYSKFLYYSLLSIFSVFLHWALVVWGFMEVNVCGDIYRGSIAFLIIMGLVRSALNGIFILKAHMH